MNRLLTCGATAAFALLNILSCSDATSPNSLSADDLSADAARTIASIQVTLASSTIDSGQTTQATAAVYDRLGRPLTRVLTWSSSDTLVATVSQSGLVTGMSVGTATITASRNGHSGSATVTVNRLGSQSVTPVASVLVALAASSIAVGQVTQATATARDSAGNALPGRTITWAMSDSSVAIVSDSGRVTGLTVGSAQVIATSEGKSGSAPLTVTTAPATTPGTVTNLKVVSFDSNSVALSFTQVDDGTGQPAKYDVRYQVTKIDWGYATSTTSGTCKTPVSATAIGATLNCTVAGLKSSTAYQFQLIAFRGTLNQNAVFGPLSNVVSATTTSSSSPPPPPPPPSDSSGSNEPAGMTYVTDRPFNSVTNSYVAGENGWWDFNSPNLSVVSDGTAPKSPTNVGALKFPAGWAGGNAPGGTERVFTPARTLYAAVWVKFSANWQSHPIANKINMIWVNGTNRIYSATMGPGGTTGAMYPYMNLQQLAANYNPSIQAPSGGSVSANLAPNVAGQTNISLVRGQWYKWEMVLYAGSPGQADGTVDWWINGAHVGHYVNIPFVTPGGDNHWTEFQWNPTWGGLGSTVSSDMYMYMDHIYLSTKP